MAAYKNIIFDLGGVLLDIDYNLTRNAFEELGIRNFDELYSQSAANELFSDLEKGNISPSVFYERFNHFTGQHFSVDQIKTAWNKMLLEFRESSLDYLKIIKPHANLILLSNTNAIHVSALHAIYNTSNREHPFEDYFHHCIYSFETGTRKPDAECYQWVLANTGIKAGETVFIDDSVQNIEAAKNSGIKSILLEKGAYIEDMGIERLIGEKL